MNRSVCKMCQVIPVVTNQTDSGTLDVILPLGERLTLTVIYAIIILFGTIANVLLLIIILSNKRLRHRKTNYFLVSLSITNLSNCLLNAPYQTFTVNINVNTCDSVTILSSKILLLLAYGFVFLAYYVLAGLSFDRYLAIAKPFVYVRLVTSKVLVLTHVLFFLLVLATILPLALMPNMLTQYKELPGLPFGFNTEEMSSVYLGFLILSTGLIPGLVISISNIFVFKIAKSFKKREQASQQYGADLAKYKLKSSPVVITNNSIQHDSFGSRHSRREQKKKLHAAFTSQSQRRSSKEQKKKQNEAFKKEYRIALSTLLLIMLFVVPWFIYALPRILSNAGYDMHYKYFLYTVPPAILMSMVMPIIILLTRKELLKAARNLLLKSRKKQKITTGQNCKEEHSSDVSKYTNSTDVSLELYNR